MCIRDRDQLAADTAVPRPVTLAAWFHDAVHQGEPQRDEEASAELAQDSLTPLVGATEAAEVGRLVRTTIAHDPDPDDIDGVWEQAKQAEKQRASALEGIPEPLNTLAKAGKVVSRSRAVHVDVAMADEPITADAVGRQILALVQRAQASGVDADQVFALSAEGGVLDTIRKGQEAAARDHDVWGVPTFIYRDQAAFVRLMDRPQGDGEHARRSIDRIVGLLVDAPELNEFKYTKVSA